MIKAIEKELSIASSFENIGLVEHLVEDVCDLFNLNEDNYGNMLIAITEAVNNAIYHGNQGNPKKQVKISFKVEKKSIMFSIKDEGAGFDYTNLPDPTNPENIEKANGRGIFLMKNLADSVEFNNKGQEVILTFITKD